MDAPHPEAALSFKQGLSSGLSSGIQSLGMIFSLAVLKPTQSSSRCSYKGLYLIYRLNWRCVTSTNKYTRTSTKTLFVPYKRTIKTDESQQRWLWCLFNPKHQQLHRASGLHYNRRRFHQLYVTRRFGSCCLTECFSTVLRAADFEADHWSAATCRVQPCGHLQAPSLHPWCRHESNKNPFIHCSLHGKWIWESNLNY